MNLYTSSVSRRFWAFAIDYVLICIVSPILITPIMFLDASEAPEWLMFLYLLIIAILVTFYIPIAETFFNGQTIGKKLLKIRVVRADGSPVSGVESLQRFLMLTFDLLTTFGMGGLISAVVSRKNQRLGDMVAGTLVVHTHPQDKSYNNLYMVDINTLTPKERKIFDSINPTLGYGSSINPIEYGRSYRKLESDISALNTIKGNSMIGEFLETQLSSVHLAMFRRKSYTWADMVAFTMRSVPQAVYACRWAILAALLVSLTGWLIGYMTQEVHHDYFRTVYGDSYADITESNIDDGNPMGIYSSDKPWAMFFTIFWNNFKVGLVTFAYGIITIFGPLLILLKNFVSFGTFDAFMVQNGCLVDALVVPQLHGTLELTSIIICGGAAFKLGTGWLFPGTMTRVKAMSRSARQAMLVLLSTIPMWFVAAFIESFVTRHTEWPMYIKLSIITVSLIFIILYYVMLPVIARRK